MPRVSFTRLNIAEMCLMRYFVQYEMQPRLQEPTSFMLESGKAVHSCVKLYKEHLHASGAEQDLEVVSLIVEQVFSEDRELRTARCYDDVFWTFRKFAQQYRHRRAHYLGGEFMVEREIPETNYVLEGWPDHVERVKDDKGPIIASIDVKSGYKDELTEENRFQGELMAWGLASMFPDQRVGWGIHWPRADKQSAVEELLPVAMPRLEAHMRAIIARIERARAENYWPITPGEGCDYCPIAAQCAKRNVLSENGVIVSTQNEADKAAGQLVVMEAARNMVIDQLKGWAKEHGPVKVESLLVGFITKEPKNLRIADAMALVWQLGRFEAVTLAYAKNLDDPWLNDDANKIHILGLGVVAALDAELLSVNGNKTKTKPVQEDRRLVGLWEPGKTTTEFGIVKEEAKSGAG